MSNHRSTQARVSNDPQLSNFEPGTALENLRAEMIDIEALARAAEAAADGLPAPTTSAWHSAASSRWRPRPRSGPAPRPACERAGCRAHRADGGRRKATTR